MNELEQLINSLKESVLQNDFVKLTLSKPVRKSDAAIIELESLLLEKFRAGTLFTLSHDLLVFVSKKKKISYKKSVASFKNKLPETHDKPKEKRAELSEYLQHLGISC